jgi:arginyl-tRNA synthetase
MISDTLQFHITKALKNLDITPPEEISIEHPDELAHGDYASNIAMVLASEVDTGPRELAVKIVNGLRSDTPDEVESVEIAGPGFINFTLTDQFLAESLERIIENGKQFGSSTIGGDRTVVVEYSSPNIAKPFTVGHLRSTVIGDAIANILAFTGHSVVRDNHIGDWGTQFGKILYALDQWGDIEAIEDSDQPMKKLVDLYVKFHDQAEDDEALNDEAREWFKRLENQDKQALDILNKLTTWSLNEFDNIYDRLGISFDTRHGESRFAPMVDEVIADLEVKGMLKESDGAKLVFFGDPNTDPEDHDLPPLMIQKSDGTSVYGARDLATDKWRKDEYGDDIQIINEVGSEQSLYFRQLFETEKRLGYFPKSQRHHVAHGLFRFEDRKMSTREGNVVWLEDVLDEVIDRAKNFNPEVAEQVGIGAIKYNDLKRDPKKDIVFDLDEMLNLEGNSGPYIQYTHARAQSVLNEAGVDPEGLPSKERVPENQPEVARLLYRFPEIVEKSADDLSPRHIANYVYRVARSFNTFYGNTKIITDDDTQTYRLLLTAATAQVLENGLKLLGIEAPEEM